MAAAPFTDLTACGDTKVFPFAALLPITVPATAPTTAPTGPATALPTTAPATPPAVCFETGRFSSGFAFDFLVAIKLILHSGIVLALESGRLADLKRVDSALFEKDLCRFGSALPDRGRSSGARQLYRLPPPAQRFEL